GQVTALFTDANGYLSALIDPAGETAGMSYSAEGLLKSFQDPRGNISTMQYDSLGRLVSEQRPAGGSWTLSRTQDGANFIVTVTSALGRTSTYALEELSIGGQRRRNTRPDATLLDTLIGKNGVTTTTAPDGTVSKLTQGPDPRFSMQAPIVTEHTIT